MKKLILYKSKLRGLKIMDGLRCSCMDKLLGSHRLDTKMLLINSNSYAINSRMN